MTIIQHFTSFKSSNTIDKIIDAYYHLHRSSIYYLLLIFTRLAKIGETSIHSLIFTNILVIELIWTYWNDLGRFTVCRFGISIHDSIIQNHTRKSYATRTTETPFFRSDGRQIRKIYLSIHSY